MIPDTVRQKGYAALGSRFRRIGERLQAETQTVIDQAGYPIKSSHYPLLFALESHGTLSVNELAAALRVSQPAVTRMVGLLEKQGAVAVRRGRGDRRTREVSMTEEGRRLIDAANSFLAPKVIGILSAIADGGSGGLISQLDHLEAELDRASFLDRLAEKRGGRGFE